MEISLLKAASAVSRTDIQAAIKMLATNSLDGVRTDTKELVTQVGSGTKDVEIKAVASTSSSPAQVNPKKGHQAQATSRPSFKTATPSIDPGSPPRGMRPTLGTIPEGFPASPLAIRRPVPNPRARFGLESVAKSSATAARRQTHVSGRQITSWNNWAQKQAPASSSNAAVQPRSIPTPRPTTCPSLVKER